MSPTNPSRPRRRRRRPRVARRSRSPAAEAGDLDPQLRRPFLTERHQVHVANHGRGCHDPTTRNGTTTVTEFHPRALRPPSNQNRCCGVLLTRERHHQGLTLEMIAAMAIPARSRVATCTAGPTRASRYTTNAVASAPANAAPETKQPRPAAPPPATMVNGSRRTPRPRTRRSRPGRRAGCGTGPGTPSPETPRPAPTSTASATRGSRSCNTMTFVALENPGGPRREVELPGEDPKGRPRRVATRTDGDRHEHDGHEHIREDHHGRAESPRPRCHQIEGCNAAASSSRPSIARGPARVTRSESTGGHVPRRPRRWRRTRDVRRRPARSSRTRAC